MNKKWLAGPYLVWMIGFIIILHIADGGIQIFVKVFLCCGFIGIVGVVDNFL